MVFSKQNNINNPYGSVRSNKVVEGERISTFNGHLQAENSNLLNYNIGELIYNKNMEWKYSANSRFLRTKRGSTLLKDITYASLGAGEYFVSGNSYIIFVDTAGVLKYVDESGNTANIKTGMNTSYRYEFWFYGLNGNETLYGCSQGEGLFKITKPVSTFVYTSITTTGAWSMSFSRISGRLFWTNGHKAYYGKIQNQTAPNTVNLETFDTTYQYTLVNPDGGTGIQRVIDDGQITFFFKDTGVWALVNAEEEIENWIQPKCNADVGTKSPDTVAYVKYGQQEVFIYLGTDKTLRLLSANVTRNSGARPTLGGGDSLIISDSFQQLLNNIPDAYISKCTGVFFDGYYVLNIVSETGTTIDTTIVLDLDKLMVNQSGSEVAQPYWFYTEYMEYKHYVIVNNQKLYGLHKNGYICRLFIENIYYEEVPNRITTTNDYRDYLVISSATGYFTNNETITGGTSGVTAIATRDVTETYLIVDNSSGTWTIGETITGSSSGITAVINSVKRRIAIDWSVYTGWFKFSSNELRLYDAYLNFNVEGKWTINFSVNSFIIGDSIPSFLDGISFPVTSLLTGAIFDYSYYNQSYFDQGVQQLSQNTGGIGRGHYFSFGFSGNKYSEWATIFSIEPRFEVVKNDTIGKNF